MHIYHMVYIIYVMYATSRICIARIVMSWYAACGHVGLFWGRKGGATPAAVCLSINMRGIKCIYISHSQKQNKKTWHGALFHLDMVVVRGPAAWSDDHSWLPGR